jgi:hypothetical protein
MASALEQWLALQAPRTSEPAPPIVGKQSLPPAHALTYSQPPTTQYNTATTTQIDASRSSAKGFKRWIAVAFALFGVIALLGVLGVIALVVGWNATGSEKVAATNAAPIAASDAGLPSSEASPISVPSAGAPGAPSVKGRVSTATTTAPVTASTAPLPPAAPAGKGKPCTPSEGCGFGEQCVGGKCACLKGYTDCGGVCTDLQRDADHCGACGKSCGKTHYCEWGKCAGCDPPFQYCGNKCVDTRYDPLNCGACGKQCSGVFCNEGECKK